MYDAAAAACLKVKKRKTAAAAATTDCAERKRSECGIQNSWQEVAASSIFEWPSLSSYYFAFASGNSSFLHAADEKRQRQLDMESL